MSEKNVILKSNILNSNTNLNSISAIPLNDLESINTINTNVPPNTNIDAISQQNENTLNPNPYPKQNQNIDSLILDFNSLVYTMNQQKEVNYLKLKDDNAIITEFEAASLNTSRYKEIKNGNDLEGVIILALKNLEMKKFLAKVLATKEVDNIKWDQFRLNVESYAKNLSLEDPDKANEIQNNHLMNLINSAFIYKVYQKIKDEVDKRINICNYLEKLTIRMKDFYEIIQNMQTMIVNPIDANEIRYKMDEITKLIQNNSTQVLKYNGDINTFKGKMISREEVIKLINNKATELNYKIDSYKKTLKEEVQLSINNSNLNGTNNMNIDDNTSIKFLEEKVKILQSTVNFNAEKDTNNFKEFNESWKKVNETLEKTKNEIKEMYAVDDQTRKEKIESLEKKIENNKKDFEDKYIEKINKNKEEIDKIKDTLSSKNIEMNKFKQEHNSLVEKLETKIGETLNKSVKDIVLLQNKDKKLLEDKIENAINELLSKLDLNEDTLNVKNQNLKLQIIQALEAKNVEKIKVLEENLKKYTNNMCKNIEKVTKTNCENLKVLKDSFDKQIEDNKPKINIDNLINIETFNKLKNDINTNIEEKMKNIKSDINTNKSFIEWKKTYDTNRNALSIRMNNIAKDIEEQNNIINKNKDNIDKLEKMLKNQEENDINTNINNNEEILNTIDEKINNCEKTIKSNIATQINEINEKINSEFANKLNKDYLSKLLEATNIKFTNTKFKNSKSDDKSDDESDSESESYQSNISKNNNKNRNTFDKEKREKIYEQLAKIEKDKIKEKEMTIKKKQEMAEKAKDEKFKFEFEDNNQNPSSALWKEMSKQQRINFYKNKKIWRQKRLEQIEKLRKSNSNEAEKQLKVLEFYEDKINLDTNENDVNKVVIIKKRKYLERNFRPQSQKYPKPKKTYPKNKNYTMKTMKNMMLILNALKKDVTNLKINNYNKRKYNNRYRNNNRKSYKKNYGYKAKNYN